MGNERSRNIGSESSPGLLPLTDLKKKQYPFENLVFEGCGAKAFAYAGAVKVLEKTGILSNIKRFSGAGTGAIVACLLAAGFSCNSLQNTVSEHLDNFLTDNQCNNADSHDDVFETFGLNAGQKFLDWFGGVLMQKCGNADITFQELYKKTGKELCIVVLNLNRMKEEYFHPKTTPNVAVRRAVLMTISIPGISQPVKFSVAESPESYYLDGGMLCNYPIHCFDGWWLSMESDNAFLQKCQPTADIRALYKGRLSGFNPKSVGFIMFDDYHCAEMYDVMKERLDCTEAVITIPQTDLGKRYKDVCQNIAQIKLMFDNFPDAMAKLREVLDKVKDCNSMVSVSDLTKELTSEESFSVMDLQTLFELETGENCHAFFQKHFDTKEMLPVTEIISIIEKRISCNFYNYSKLSPRSNVTNLSSFWGTINNSIHENHKLTSKDDLSRTVGIYTGHISNNDIDLGEADEVYLFQHGWNCTVAFLRQFSPMSTITPEEMVSISTQAPPHESNQELEATTEPTIESKTTDLDD